MRKFLSNPTAITVMLCVQFIPLVMFPPSSFAGTSQEWWLPGLLAVLAIIGVVQLVFRHNPENWPWYLVGFAQGFNIISRLMMLLPHATLNGPNGPVFNPAYVILTSFSMLFSAFLLWYTEWPEVRQGLLKNPA